MLLSCETVRISSPAFYKDPPLHESQFRSPADVEINSLASFDAARVKDLFVLLPWLLPLRLGCSARRLGSAARHSSKAAWRLGSPARHGGALRQLATPRGDSARRPRRRGPVARLGSPAQRRGGARGAAERTARRERERADRLERAASDTLQQLAAAERDVTSAKLSILRLEKDVETRDEAIVTRRHEIANLRRTCVKHVEDAKVAEVKRPRNSK